MNGAEILIKTAVESGVEVCFANPGTTEMPLVGALDSVPNMRAVLGLFEGVCTGAADGYGRMKGKPAMTLLHLGPGFSNGLANLHNAKRAHTPIVNLIGDHATWHLAADAPLTMDINALAKTVGVSQSFDSVESISNTTLAAIQSAIEGQVVSLIVPHDYQWSEVQNQPVATLSQPDTHINQASIVSAAELLHSSSNALLLIGGYAARKEGLAFAAKIKEKTGCELAIETFPAHLERGAGTPVVGRLPYFPERAIDVLSKFDTVVMAGAASPVSFFGYKEMPSQLLTENQKSTSLQASPHGIPLALEQLADAVTKKSHDNPVTYHEHQSIERPTGALKGKIICQALAALQPENAIVIDESVTSGGAYFHMSSTSAPHSVFTLPGGAIGYGMPCAVGAAIACPDRPVFSFQADGSAMYTFQALWTQAQEQLNITTLLCSNKKYNILQMEYARAGYETIGDNTKRLTEFNEVPIDWVKMSQSMGVPAVSVDSAERLSQEIEKSMKEPGPHLIEIPL